ncbi:hypothetical protein [Pseudomonas sp. RIT-PI-AD]|uniref:hypothetical protein n=1 Tax=Pseudomonas sp. RIT-PI-AD TaxID=3035294 RepID=UPI0021D920A1|nr:hypothetical protein [Pseudomonas sp. RIT-PI-AD]
MSKPLSLETATRLIHEAFKPYSGHIQEENGGLSFSVSDVQGKEVFAASNIPSQEYSDAERFAERLQQARAAITDKGLRLEPWTMPCLTDGTGIPETPPNY